MLGSSFDTDENGVFKIAMKEYGGGKVNPVLYFTVTSPLLTENADVAACVAAANVAASPTAAVKALATTTYKITSPGTWQYSIKRGSDTVASDKVGNAGRLDIAGWPSTVSWHLAVHSYCDSQQVSVTCTVDHCAFVSDKLLERPIICTRWLVQWQACSYLPCPCIFSNPTPTGRECQLGGAVFAGRIMCSYCHNSIRLQHLQPALQLPQHTLIHPKSLLVSQQWSSKGKHLFQPVPAR